MQIIQRILQKLRRQCKSCYGKGWYSVWSAGGEFGDSFDGKIYLEGKIEHFPCRKCNKNRKQLHEPS